MRCALQMDPITEELDDSVSLAAGRLPSSLSQLSHLQAFVRRNSFDAQGRRYAWQRATCGH